MVPEWVLFKSKISSHLFLKSALKKIKKEKRKRKNKERRIFILFSLIKNKIPKNKPKIAERVLFKKNEIDVKKNKKR